MLLLLSGSALASGRIDVGREVSLTIDYHTAQNTPIAGAAFELYRVAAVSEKIAFTPTAQFAGYAEFMGEDVTEAEWQILADRLARDMALADPPFEVYANASGEICRTETDAEGRIVFGELETGLYLLVGENVVADGVYYSTLPTLVSLPTRAKVNAPWQYEPCIQPKPDELPDEPIDLTVQKNWSGDSEDARPAQITVQLIKDGKPVEKSYGKVVLSKENNWQHAWKDLPPGVYTVKETPVPDGYKDTYEHKEGLEIVTNTKPAPPGGGKLPQTGLLWWPVPVLAAAGMALFALGWKRSRRKEG